MKPLSLPRRFPLISADEPALYESQIEARHGGGASLFSRFENSEVTRFPLRSGLFNRVTREVHAVENIRFDLWPTAKRYRWWAGSVAENRRPDARCCGWLNPGRGDYL